MQYCSVYQRLSPGLTRDPTDSRTIYVFNDKHFIITCHYMVLSLNSAFHTLFNDTWSPGIINHSFSADCIT